MYEKENQLVEIQNAEVGSLTLPGFSGKSLTVDILRLDKIHPVVSGNKWFKLKNYLHDAKKKQIATIVTFGGAWSNHIIASAYAARAYGFKAIGIIRGERPLALSLTLQSALDHGMTLEFISRHDYSMKNDESFKAILEKKFGKIYCIPEGGAGIPGVEGSREILSLTQKDKYSHIICCMGTGTMFAGLADSSLLCQEIIGIPVLKGMTYTPDRFTKNPLKNDYCKIINEYHFGGYAKKTTELIRFMNYFYTQTGIPTDFVYTGKLMFALADLVMKNYFPMGSTVLVVHSGGLQGNASLAKGTLLF